jgi:ectoine hydroxylase-related dioxygenase (phytanoyl-CoA dioxygenase family)
VLTRDGVYLRWRADGEAPAASCQLQEDGWALLPGVFSDAAVAELAADILRVYAEVPADRRRPERDPGEFEQFRYEMFNRSALCQRAIGERAILDVIEPLLGEDCHVIANTAWWNPPALEHTHGGGRWHLDAGPHVPLPEGLAWDTRIPHPVFAVAAHILLQDCPVVCGPTGVIPGSHLSGQAPPADRLDDPELTWNGQRPVVLEARAGDVQLFVSDVWHRRMPTGAGDAGRFFLQVHYGRRDIAQRVRPTSEVNHLGPEAEARQGLGFHQWDHVIGGHLVVEPPVGVRGPAGGPVERRIG